MTTGFLVGALLFSTPHAATADPLTRRPARAVPPTVGAPPAEALLPVLRVRLSAWGTLPRVVGPPDARILVELVWTVRGAVRSTRSLPRPDPADLDPLARPFLSSLPDPPPGDPPRDLTP
jgi:hypothetical protein